MAKAINIQWDTDGDEEALASLPTEVELPEDVFWDNRYDNKDEYLDAVSDWLSDTYGFLHYGFTMRGMPNFEDMYD